MYAMGAEFVEVRVHAQTREIRVPRIVGAFAAGRIMNTRTARSQYMGAMIWGISSALHEATEIDPRNARYVNDNLADYLIPVNADIQRARRHSGSRARRLRQPGRRQRHRRTRQCRHRGGGRQRRLSRHRRAGSRIADPAGEAACLNRRLDLLTRPREQHRRKIRRRTPPARFGLLSRMRAGVRFDDLAIEMPGGVAKHRHHHG